MSRPTERNPDHRAVAWETLAVREGGTYVDVTCPTCHVRRPELAKYVRGSINRGTFTGLCRHDAHRGSRLAATVTSHAAVRWEDAFVRDHVEWVPVICPACLERRELPAKSVRNQVKRGNFTGLCTRDRLVGKTRADSPEKPTSPWVDWNDVEVVAEKGTAGRRRTMIRVRCPECAAQRLVNPTYLRLLIKADAFRPECAEHRRRATPIPMPSRTAGEPGSARCRVV